MTAQTTSLSALEYIPYIDENGELPEQYQGKIGVYAIFDQEKVLQFVGYSRDVYLSLKQHVVRQPQNCYWVKIQTIDKPSRAVLESIEKGWIEQNGTVPSGNGDDKEKWTQPINAKAVMTPDEKVNYEHQIEEIGQTKVLKNVARRVESEILAVLQQRGLQMQLRFNPKLKEEGLLDLK